MAPRGRSRTTQRGRPKKGERRVDAALDALKPWGFSEDQILKTVHDLLQVYGDDGWPFLEEGYYKLVVDTILEEQEKEQENEQKRRLVEDDPSEAEKNCSPGDGTSTMNTAMPLGVAHRSEAVKVEATSMDAGNMDDKGESAKWKDISCVASASPNATFVRHPSGCREVKETGILCVSHTLQPESTHPCPRRRPCYGWIDDDSGKEEGLSSGPGVPHGTDIILVLSGAGSRPKRKSRWDVMPSDI